MYGVTKLQKSSGGMSRNPKSEKYFLSVCQERAEENKFDWVQILSEIKKVNVRDVIFQKSQILLADMKDNHAKVIIKIGDDERIAHEYLISKKLIKSKGFVKFVCFFQCEDNFRDFFHGKRQGLCKSRGDSMKIIIMPFFPLGSISGYKWDEENINVLRNSLAIACLHYADAYLKTHFVHNDFHAGNILLKHSKERQVQDIQIIGGMRPWICDFENSKFDASNEGFQHLKYDLQKLFFLLPTMIPNIEKSGAARIASAIENQIQSVDDIESKLRKLILNSVSDLRIQRP
jgi:serine/threonine protein kinase